MTQHPEPSSGVFNGAGPAPRDPRGRKLALLAWSTLGIVYGDIGTSPLYAIRASFMDGGAPVTSSNVLGVLSLVFWSLILVVSINYLGLIMQADNRGEGGVLALMALAIRGGHGSKRRAIGPLVALGLFGTALLYGDGLITPATQCSARWKA